MMTKSRMRTMLKVSWQIKLNGVVWITYPLSFLNLANVHLISSSFGISTQYIECKRSIR